jgi:hypothetical protein
MNSSQFTCGFLRGQNLPSVNLTTRFDLVPRLQIGGALAPLLCMSSMHLISCHSYRSIRLLRSISIGSCFGPRLQLLSRSLPLSTLFFYRSPPCPLRPSSLTPSLRVPIEHSTECFKKSFTTLKVNINLFRRHLLPIAVAERSKARTVFARSNTAIVGSNPTEAWMFVCVLCAFFLFLHSLKRESQLT